MPITANDPNRKTWLETSETTDFPIQNIPFGVFLTRDDVNYHRLPYWRLCHRPWCSASIGLF